MNSLKKALKKYESGLNKELYLSKDFTSGNYTIRYAAYEALGYTEKAFDDEYYSICKDAYNYFKALEV